MLSLMVPVKPEPAAVLVFLSEPLQRWIICADRRSNAAEREPRNKLLEAEKQHILELCNSSEFASLPPNVIVPALAEKGAYIASESTCYCVLKSANQLGKKIPWMSV